MKTILPGKISCTRAMIWLATAAFAVVVFFMMPSLAAA